MEEEEEEMEEEDEEEGVSVCRFILHSFSNLHRDFRQVVRIAQSSGDVEPEVMTVLNHILPQTNVLETADQTDSTCRYVHVHVGRTCSAMYMYHTNQLQI